MNQTSHRTALPFIVFFCLLISGCGNLKNSMLSDAVKKPDVSIDSIGVSGITANSIGLNLTMKVRNPNAYALALAGYDYDVKFNGMPLVNGATDQGFRIPAGETGNISIPLTLAFNDVRKIYDSMGESNTVDYSADVDLRLDAPILNLFRINSKKEGSVTIPRLPKVSFGNIKVKNFSFTDIDMTLDMAVDNPNEFAMTLKDLVYDISVGGRQWISGGMEENLAIGKNKVSQVSIPLKIRLSELSSGLLSALKSGNFNDFAVNGSFMLDGDHAALQNIKVPINFKK